MKDSQPKQIDGAAFVQHLEDSSQIVRTWEPWKRGILGGRNKSPESPNQRNDLHHRDWAVIGAHYVSCDLTHAEALAEAEDLQARNQPGVNIVTNEVAYRLLESRPEASKRAA